MLVFQLKMLDKPINPPIINNDAQLQFNYPLTSIPMMLGFTIPNTWEINTSSPNQITLNIKSTTNIDSTNIGEKYMPTATGPSGPQPASPPSTFTSSKINFIQMTKYDATEAAYRIASKQVSRLVRAGFLKMMRGKGMKKGQLKAFNDFLCTDAGEALISAMLGYGLTFAPVVKDHRKIQIIAKEFRVNAMATAGNALIEALLAQIIPSLMPILEQMPDPKVVKTLIEPEEDIQVELDDVIILSEELNAHS